MAKEYSTTLTMNGHNPNYTTLSKGITRHCNHCKMSFPEPDKCIIITPEPIPQELLTPLGKQGITIETKVD